MLSFSGILAAAVLTVDTTFLILFFIFLLSVFPLSLEWNCAAEPRRRFACPSYAHGARSKIESRA